MKLAPIQRTGPDCFQWDDALDHGHNFSEGQTLEVSAELAHHLSGVEGWARPVGTAPELVTDLEG